jgi:hypothetical protein
MTIEEKCFWALLTALIAYAVNALLLPKSGADHGMGDC